VLLERGFIKHDEYYLGTMFCMKKYTQKFFSYSSIKAFNPVPYFIKWNNSNNNNNIQPDPGSSHFPSRALYE